MPYTMPSITKNIKGIIKKIKESGFFLSLLAFLIITSGLLIALVYPNFSVSNENARYLLSALAQSQAAIIAVVVTLTLIAVQLASQTYSPRVMDLFLKSWAFHLLLLIYGTAIMYDLAILCKIPSVSADNAPKMIFVFGYALNFDFLVVLGLSLMVVALAALFWFIKVVMDGLRPENIIDRIIKGIDKKEAVNFAIEERSLEKDPLLPMFDTLKKLIDTKDETAVMLGVIRFGALFADIMSNGDIHEITSKNYDDHVKRFDLKYYSVEEYRKKNYNMIAEYFLQHLTTVSNIAIKKKSEDILGAVAYSLGTIGVISAEKGLEDSGVFAVRLLKEIGIISIEGKVRDESVSLGEIAEEYYGGVLLFRSGYSFGFVLHYLNDIGKTATERLFEVQIGDPARDREAQKKYWTCGGTIVCEVVSSLGILGKIAIERGFEEEAKIARDDIYNFGSIILEKGIGIIAICAHNAQMNPIFPVICWLKAIFTASTTRLCYENAETGMTSLGNFGRILSEKNASPIAIIEAIEEVYKFHQYEKYYELAYTAVESLFEIGKLTASTNRKDSTRKISSVLKEIVVQTTLKKNIHWGRWENIVNDTPKYIIMLATILMQGGNMELVRELINDLKDIEKAYNDKKELKAFIHEVLRKNETEKTFGFRETFRESGKLSFKERKMTDDEFNAFKQFKKHYKEDVTI
jgi:Predicted membrane protein